MKLVAGRAIESVPGATEQERIEIGIAAIVSMGAEVRSAELALLDRLIEIRA